MQGYLGIDVGSVTTKVVFLSKKGAILWSTYRKTMGQPIWVLQSALSDLYHELTPTVLGVGATGSGRGLASHLIGADVVKNEITSHAVAAIRYYPDVQTIVEIGGQDSKLILIRDGVVIDFSMNTVCAAGTGSFLEHQASRLGLRVEELGTIALNATSPVRIAGRCTVFAESDMIHKQQMGHNLEDIVAGLCDALVRNYLNNLSRGKDLREPILFQGGVAANHGIKTSLEKELKKEILVPKYFSIMGAIGAALLALECEVKATKFKGFRIFSHHLISSSFYCDGCPNTCGVMEVRDGNEVIARWGDNCGKWSSTT
ncbi:MAG: 2-hydroxyglutaryl-CoA dehydratase [Nitrospira sp.]|nr:2-hydroxyglutaryl-CoA dehydratase [Nitrospira sp.]